MQVFCYTKLSYFVCGAMDTKTIKILNFQVTEIWTQSYNPNLISTMNLTSLITDKIRYYSNEDTLSTIRALNFFNSQAKRLYIFDGPLTVTLLVKFGTCEKIQHCLQGP